MNDIVITFFIKKTRLSAGLGPGTETAAPYPTQGNRQKLAVRARPAVKW